MNHDNLDKAVVLLCEKFVWHCDVEILVVGGAAGMLTGLFTRDRSTGDFDVINYCPKEAWAEVERVAGEIGTEMSLPTNWLNSKVLQRVDSLPNGWENRKQLLHRGQRLSVYAAGRPDLIAMKFLAGRPQDLEDIDVLSPTKDDIVFVETYLDELPAKGTPSAEIEAARLELENWK